MRGSRERLGTGRRSEIALSAGQVDSRKLDATMRWTLTPPPVKSSPPTKQKSQLLEEGHLKPFRTPRPGHMGRPMDVGDGSINPLPWGKEWEGS